MKHYYFLILAFLACNLSYAQTPVSIHRSDRFAEVGTVLDMALDSTISDIDTLSSGEDKEWDFTSLSEEHDITLSYREAAGTPYATDFPGTDYVEHLNIVGEPYESYKYFEDNTTELSGYGVGYTSHYGISVVEEYEEPGTYQFPIDFGSGYSPYTLSYTMKYEEGQDSVKREITIIGADTIDAHGTASMPNGNTYDVLREKLYYGETENVYVKSPDATEWTHQSTSTNTVRLFRWLTKDIGGLLLSIRIDGMGTPEDLSDDVMSYARFYQGEEPALGNFAAEESKFSIYPNPSPNGNISIKGDKISEDASVKVSDITGKKIYEGSASDIPALSSGVFLVTVTDGDFLKTERIVVK